jgi:hypothetical protein
MHLLTRYYKNLSEDLEKELNFLSNIACMLSENSVFSPDFDPSIGPEIIPGGSMFDPAPPFGDDPDGLFDDEDDSNPTPSDNPTGPSSTPMRNPVSPGSIDRPTLVPVNPKIPSGTYNPYGPLDLPPIFRHGIK